MIKGIAISLLLVACGGKAAEPAKPAPVAETKAGGDEHEHMSPELAKFHDVLAPRWHAAKGPERMKSTCDAMPDFTSGATAIAMATPPKGAEDAWTDRAGKLAAALQDLDATCKANDATKFETAFEAVHVSFHGLMEASGGEHEHHDEHTM
ncbi:MAG TPA: hypothetical protein VF403_27120 [Kofleriaceae bacterium]